MKDYIGAVDPEAKIQILHDGKSKSVKLCDLKPGDFVGQVESKWYFQVSEVRIFKRELTAYSIILESGESAIIAEGTIVCGQYGGSLITDAKDNVLCLVNMGYFYDEDDSRRCFRAEFRAPAESVPLVKTICRYSANRQPWNPRYHRKFYRYSDLLRFLTRIHQKHDNIRIVPGLEIGGNSNSKLYDLAKVRRGRGLFFPLFPFTTLNGPDANLQLPALLAFSDGSSYQLESRKIVSCNRITSNGPWAFPIFDEFHHSRISSHQRFSFTVNGIPVFYPNDFIGRWAAKATFSNAGEPQLPPTPDLKPRQPVCHDLNSVFFELGNLKGDNDSITPANIPELTQTLFATMHSLSEAGISEETVTKALEEKVLDLFRKCVNQSPP